MTIKQMFKKVENYNTMTNEFGLVEYRSDEKAIEISMYHGGWAMMDCEYFETYEDFAKYAKERFISELTKAVLANKNFEFNKETMVETEYDGFCMFATVVGRR